MRSCLPISASRMATLNGSARASRTISRPDTSPMLTCGSKNSARSDAIAMSEVVTRSSPAPQQRPLTAVEDRLGHRPERWRGLLGCLPLRVGGEVGLLVDHATVVGDLADVGAGAEGPARAGDDDGPDRVVALGAVVGVAELSHHERAHGVELIGPVEGDRRHPVGHLVDDGFEGHRILASGPGTRGAGAP